MAVLPYVSSAVMVRLSAAPAVGVVVAALSERLAVLARPTVTESGAALLLMVPSETTIEAGPAL